MDETSIYFSIVKLKYLYFKQLLITTKDSCATD